MLDPALTRLLAVNSIYFKGMWKSRFQPGDTKMRSFSGGDGRAHQVPMMSQLSVYPIGQLGGDSLWVVFVFALVKMTPLNMAKSVCQRVCIESMMTTLTQTTK